MMSIVFKYARQYPWRSWQFILDALPLLQDQSVLDLGCGIGDVSSVLANRGAHVVGIDGHSEIIEHAKKRRIANAEFRVDDLRTIVKQTELADGIWCSFAAAYFPILDSALVQWRALLKPGGWIALVEIDDMFAHEPVSTRTSDLLDGYVNESLASNRYDFRMGRKIANFLDRSGFRVESEFTVPDLELSFDGPAISEVLDAWRDRFSHMRLLQEYCGDRFEETRDDFISSLMRSDHMSKAKVVCCIARCM